MALNDIQTRWLDALRSDRYKQGYKQLRTVSDQGTVYCCLGVLCDLVNPDGWEKDFNSDDGFPPVSILSQVGVEEGLATQLVRWNDDPGHPLTFAQIANKLEDKWTEREES